MRLWWRGQCVSSKKTNIIIIIIIVKYIYIAQDREKLQMQNLEYLGDNGGGGQNS